MITIEEFARLINLQEGPTLDFKREQYRLLDDSNKEELSKLIKDIIAFSNTIRNSASYIIIGVDDSPNEKKLVGLDQFIDDAVFQDKTKDKISPKPNFKYYSIEYDGKRYGVLEFPLFKHSKPLESLFSGKGLEKGKVYFRRGSINSECTIDEIIQINDWLRTIKSNLSLSEKNKKITALMAKVNSGEHLLSSCLAECLGLAKELEDSELEFFCKAELQGWHTLPDFKTSQAIHRSVMAYASWHQIQVFPYEGYTVETLFSDLKNQEGFFQRRVNFGESISTLENMISKNKGKEDTTLAIVQMKAKDVFEGITSNATIYIYTHPHQIKEVYQQTRQFLINELIKRTN